MNDEHPTALQLQVKDIAAAAYQLAVPAASIATVVEVESAGRPFLPDGRPSILFERHIFRRQLLLHRVREHVQELAALHPDIINAAPGGYQSGQAEHRRLAEARQIDDSAALESASWGAFQIMGFHWKRLGYGSVQAFAEAMSTNAAEQLWAFVRFIQQRPALHTALKARRWADFARLYNGPDYRQNRYDTKLVHAFNRHSAATAAE